jgi:hypothetical protein
MGRPDGERTSEGMPLWSYGFSRVKFRDGRVAGWEDHDHNLRTRGAGDTRVTKEEPLSRPLEGGGSVPAGAIVHGVSGGSRGSGHTNPEVQHVGGYQRSDGTQVGGYIRTRANASGSDNFSSRGNVNPFTRERGSR